MKQSRPSSNRESELRLGTDHNSEYRNAFDHLTLALDGRRKALLTAVEAVNVAAAGVADEQLHHWEAFVNKLWGAQVEVVERHGLNVAGRHGSPRVAPRQLRKAWVGSTAGVVVPLCTFGVASFSQGLILPLFWVLAVVADVAGRTVCMRLAPVSRAALNLEPLNEPSGLIAKTRFAMSNARNTGDWRPMSGLFRRLGTLERSLRSGDMSLRHARRLGGCFAAVALAVLALTTVGNGIAYGHRAMSWAVMVTSLAGVFGATLAMTSNSYREAVERPPYPRDVSVDQVAASLRYERALSRVPAAAFTSASLITEYVSEAVRRPRPVVVALREVGRCERETRKLQRKVDGLRRVGQEPEPSVAVPDADSIGILEKLKRSARPS